MSTGSSAICASSRTHFAKNNAAHRCQIAIEIDGADQRFESIRQCRVARAPAARFFAAPQHEMLAEIEGESVLFQRFARNQPRTQFR